MILPYLSQLNSERIVLASGSPRRQELLHNIGLKFDVCVSDAEEDGDRSDPEVYVQMNAEKKGATVWKTEKANLLIAADTVVFIENEILEKPKSEEHAYTLLKRLSGNVHQVVTGVALFTPSDIYRFSEKTYVEIDTLSDEFIWSYIKTKDPMDKAGAYGIQGMGASFIKSINGCYYNVMGFPVSRFVNELITRLDLDKK